MSLSDNPCRRATLRGDKDSGSFDAAQRAQAHYFPVERDWRIYADFAQRLIDRARTLYAHDSFGIELDHTVYSLDSITIELCLSMFPWGAYWTASAEDIPRQSRPLR